MATAVASGCDFASNLGSSASAIAAFAYNGTAQNGSSGPASGTKMTFVGRYIGNGAYGGGANSGNSIGSTELADYLAQSLSVFFFYEDNYIQPSVYPSTYLANTTYAQGQADAYDARNYLTSLGISLTNQAVYFAVDYDSNTPAEINALVPYFNGIQSIMGAANTGMYGNGALYTALIAPSPALITYFCQSRSTGYTGNGNYISGQNLWQWPPSYSPTGSPVVNGHTVDGQFAYTTNFGQYPLSGPPPPTTGVLTAGSASVGAVTYEQGADQTLIVPDNNYDQILWSQTGGQITVANSVGVTDGVLIASTGINQTAYPIGNFTFDGGESYADFGFMPGGAANLFGTFYAPTFMPPVVIQATVDPLGDLYFNISVEDLYNGGTPSNLTVTYNVAIMASYNPSEVPHESGTISLAQVGAYSNMNLSPGAQNTYATYRRIANDFAITEGGYNYFAHNLGEVPNILFWTESTGGTTLINSIDWYCFGESSNGAYLGIAMDDTYIYYYLDAALDAIYFRLYKDN